MKEYGGYLECEHYHGKAYHENALGFNSASSALEYFLRKNNIRKIYLPYYLGESLCNAARKIGVRIGYYNLRQDFFPLFTHQMSADEILIIVNYFGQLSDEVLLQLQKQYAYILVDNTQAFFNKAISGIPTIYSCRKFFGVPDGGYLCGSALKTSEFDMLPRESAIGRLDYLVGRFEKNAAAFYTNFAEREREIHLSGCKRMSTLAENWLKSFNYEKVKSQRQRNCITLHTFLEKYNLLPLQVTRDLFMYPLLISNGATLKQQLIQLKIYVPTLWKEALNFPDMNKFARNLVENLVLLPIDQRYNEKDMEYIARVVLGLIQKGE